jgi:hypothetical protein
VEGVRPILVDHHAALKSIVAIASDVGTDFEKLNLMPVFAKLKSRRRSG